MHKFLTLTSFILLFVTLVGCDSVQKVIAPEKIVSPETVNTVKIGFLASGSRVTYPNGAEIAASEINARGGLLGMPVELVIVSEIPTAEAAVEAASKMILDDNVIALVGPNRSAHAIPVGVLAQEHRVPMVTTTATNPAVTRAGDFVFMAAFTDSFQGAVMARFAKDNLNITTAAVLTRSGDPYTEGIADFFARNFGELGGKIVAAEFYGGIATDWTAQLTNIAAAKPDVLFIASFSPEVSLITQQARAIPLQNAAGAPTIFLGADSWDNAILLLDENAEIEGSFFSGHFSPDTDEPNAQAFVNTYESIYESTPTGGVAVSYDAVKLLFEAVERAGSLDPEKIRDQLAATENYIGATTIAGYDENRHPTKSAVIFTIKDGQKQFHKQTAP
jgi:branched-chain amino acid transport system substrate-binding protein